MASWSSIPTIKQKLLNYWDRGYLLKHYITEDDFFPLKIKLKSPTINEISSQFSDVIKWVEDLNENDKSNLNYGYEIIEETHTYRLYGTQSIPTHIVIPSFDDAIKLIKKQKETNLFTENLKKLLDKWPCLYNWCIENPHKLYKNIGRNCDKIIIVIEWFKKNPKHYMYLRQLDIAGIDTKFIESHKNIIDELMSIILPTEDINKNTKIFEQRFYLKEKPKMIRFRILDEDFYSDFTDLTVTIYEFEKWRPAFKNIFFTENEINFLSFPLIKDSIIIFGKGYGVEIFKKVEWINDKNVYYWGDIDTHGFNILSIARSFIPNMKSFLMTEDILLFHKDLWAYEDKPFLSEVYNLTTEEHALLSNLQTNYWGEGVRLEQERISYHFVKEFIETLV